MGKRKKSLLMIDEIQHLSTSPAFDGVTHSLRTMLDKRQGNVKAIFTGSSRHYMNLLFTQMKSSFYLFGDDLPFPNLGDDFLSFIQDTLKAKHDIEIDRKELIKAWKILDRSPFWLMRVINRLITAESSLTAATNYIVDLLRTASGHESIIMKMKPADKIVFCAIADNQTPYGKKTLDTIETTTSVKGNKSNVQRSLDRLRQWNVISKDVNNEFRVEAPELKSLIDSDNYRIKNS